MDEREVFVAVVEAQGFSAAAKRLESTPAAISRRVKALEQRLGVRLLQRTTRRVQLTEAGELYFAEIRRLLAELNDVEQQVQAVTGEPAGDLRVVAPMSFGQRRLAPVVARFALAYPRLRVSLQRTSNVNMEALEELEGLQARYDELHSQYQDLTAAKDSLQRIIGRINADSRRLFLDTLEAIRQNFQKLYRKSFGGGQADLILEESDDPLEAGVEIVATPPGKPSFSNSLLSGGEKALTAVALLMAIFQYRPSPFCVLDEVDAPFDEANIGRFVTVLNEFLDHSKFVVVTHSKKTMTAATTLYGVTMQESGISKQVSIRFEDVSDDGEINEGEAA